ncbi:hypothetical protein PC112_g9055 [Phytophthora cactorum]|nr:hypothetical protein PC112_g9055 [Phytophthora cactorum]
MTRTNKKRKNPPGSLPDDAAKGPGVKDDGRGLSISSQHVRNLLKARLGHGNAVQRLKVVLAELVADTGNACVLLQGEWDQTTGIVLQTKAQREIFSR